MAAINVIQPQAGWGTITVLDSTPSHYTVRYNPPWPMPEELVFYGFSVYCHACHQTLLHSSSYTATFNIEGLESSGHPGPFDVSAVLRGFWDLEIYSAPDDPNRGSTSPTSYVREFIPLGETVSVTLTATAKEGWEFSHWTNDDDLEWKSTSRSVTVRYKSDEADDLIVVRYVAHFTPPRINVKLRSRGVSVILSTARQDPEVEGRRIVTNGSQYDYQDKLIGYLYKEGKYNRGSTVTFTFTMMPYGTSKYVALGWEVVKSSSEIESYAMTDSFTYELPDQEEIEIRILIGDKDEASVILITDTSAYGYITLGGSLAVFSTNDDIGERGEKIHIEKHRVSVRDSKYSLIVSKVSTKDNLNGGYHGYSINGVYTQERIENLTEGQNLGIITISDLTAGGEATVVVFMCSHALMHNDDSGQIEYKDANNQLVYECYVPE